MPTKPLVPIALLLILLTSAPAALAEATAPAAEEKPVIAKEDIFGLLAPLAESADEASAGNEPQDVPANVQPPRQVKPSPPRPVDVPKDDEPSTIPPAVEVVPADEFFIEPSPTEPIPTEPKTTDLSPIQPRPAPAVVAPSSPPPEVVWNEQMRLLFAPAPRGTADAAAPHVSLLVAQPGQLTRLSQDQLRAVLGQTVQDCLDDLADIHYGDRWQKFLRLEQIQAQLAPPQVGGPAASVRETQSAALGAIRDRFLEIAADAKYRSITTRPSFRAVAFTLNEYLAEPQQRDRRRDAFDNLQQLSSALNLAPTGRQWHSFLQLAELETLLATPGPLSAEETAKLKSIQARFAQATSDPRYKIVTTVPGFNATYAHVQTAAAVPTLPREAEQAPVELTGKPVPKGAGPLLRVVSQRGGCHFRPPYEQQWKLIEQVQAISSGSGIHTGEGASARLLIGETAQLALGPNSALLIAQHLDDEGRVVTAIRAQSGTVQLTIKEPKAEDGPANSPAASDVISGQHIVLSFDDYRIHAGDRQLQLDLRLEADQRRAFAALRSGTAEVVNEKTGDRVILQPGREAVLVPKGVAVRPFSLQR